MEKKRAASPVIVVAGALVLLFVAGIIVMRTSGGPSGNALFQPCMKDFSSESFKSVEQEKNFYAYVTSRTFIVTILERNPRYAPLLSELDSFWKPTAAGGRFVNGDGNGLETSFSEEYQDLFDQLRTDVYKELDVQLEKYGWGRSAK